jgi:metallo-beta-lactamase family protein
MTTLQFLGAAGTVTGSKFLVDAGDTRFMVDCGMFQGAKKLRLLNWDPCPVRPSSVDHVILTHAHIDHVGMLPRLVREGFQGPVWCTPATRDLTGITLIDAGHLQEEDARFATKKGFSKHKPPLPLYTVQDSELAIKLLQAVEYNEDLALSSNTRIRFRDAGHILGSGIVEAEIKNSGAPMRIVFSGDLGRYHAKILRDPTPVVTGDYLVVESTYGNREHPAGEVSDQLAQIINETVNREGTLVVPAFALGRTQTLLYMIRELKTKGLVPDLPIFVDSPMAVDMTKLFGTYVKEFDVEAQEVFRSTGRCPILCSNLHMIDSREESKRLNGFRNPAVIISASGMATGGRILHHLKQRLPEPRNTVLFIGFQPYGTRGQLLKDGAQKIKIHGEEIPVRAQVRSLESLSAHADANEILFWLQSFQAPPRRTFIVHGEPNASAALAERIGSTFRWTSHIPEYLETVELV